MRLLIYFLIPLWTGISAANFIVFASGFATFGFTDETYGDFLGWMVFSFATFANAIIIFSTRWCYVTLKYYTWITVLGALLVWLSHPWLNPYALVISINAALCLLSDWELWITWKHGRLVVKGAGARQRQ